MIISYQKRQKKTKLTNSNSNDTKNGNLDDLDKEKVFSGEEDFMNALHPFEEMGKNAGKKSTPIQKAIISVIKKNGNSASEEQILEYVKDKWDLIEKYSDRKFLDKPTIRIIRLNCAVKKNSRRLFLEDPIHPRCWMLNTVFRRRRTKRSKVKAEPTVEKNTAENTETESEYSEDLKTEYIMPNDTFEQKIEFLIRDTKKPLSFDEICNLTKEYESMKGIFKKLPFHRRVRAALIVLKSEKKAMFNEVSKTWAPFKDEAEVSEETNSAEYTESSPSTLSLADFYNKVSLL